jgi:hypothetical protein
MEEAVAWAKSAGVSHVDYGGDLRVTRIVTAALKDIHQSKLRLPDIVQVNRQAFEEQFGDEGADVPAGTLARILLHPNVRLPKRISNNAFLLCLSSASIARRASSAAHPRPPPRHYRLSCHRYQAFPGGRGKGRGKAGEREGFRFLGVGGVGEFLVGAVGDFVGLAVGKSRVFEHIAGDS